MTKLSGKEVLVTGYGFVGRHLVKRLVAEGAKITILDRNLEHLVKLNGERDISVMKTDLRHLHQNLEFDYVFHTASLTHVGYGEANYIKTYEDNVVATLNLLKHIKVRERFLFTSSAVVYSNTDGRHSEGEDLHPISLYGLSKIAGEQLVRHFGERAGFGHTIFRFFNIYGEGQKEFFLVPQVVSEALAHRRITLWNRKSTRDFIYIGDIVDGMVGLSKEEAARCQTINMGTGKGTSTGDLASMVSEILGGVEIEDKQYYDPASLATLIADTSRAESIGFSARTTLREGLERVIREQGVPMEVLR